MRKILCWLLGHRWNHGVILTGNLKPDGVTRYRNRVRNVCTRCLRERVVRVYVAPDPLGRDIRDVPPDDVRYRWEEE